MYNIGSCLIVWLVFDRIGPCLTIKFSISCGVLLDRDPGILDSPSRVTSPVSTSVLDLIMDNRRSQDCYQRGSCVVLVCLRQSSDGFEWTSGCGMVVELCRWLNSPQFLFMDCVLPRRKGEHVWTMAVKGYRQVFRVIPGIRSR
ncbi:hypothetical protein V6N11_008448 [Hibiscus sabdariffa]|uniref:Uncharacterized protein n=1 Tax=Hibiscus sabdariffa TaxID=183260 RepID=A0ABR1ZVG2_9ROSI